ncbi:MAG: hypothetical protein JJ897_04235 [Marinibacterium sp.]|nr:hypothetical protein [Marinibacterium sp.]
MAQTIGIGGIFFWAKNSKALSGRYKTRLKSDCEIVRFARIHDREGNPPEPWKSTEPAATL